MTTRTRKATTSTAPAPANKATAKKTSRTPGKTTAPKTPQPRLSQVKTDTTPPAKKTTTKAAATRAAAKKAAPWPEFITHKMITAHYQAQLHGLPTRNIRDWRETNGIAAITFPTGARIDHTPTDDAPFHAHTPCKNGGIHYDPVRTTTDLHNAAARAQACTDRHGAPAALALGTGLKRAKTTTADTQPIPVITKPEKPSGDDVADTQPMSADAIAAHIAEQLTERAADTETPKEHPEP